MNANETEAIKIIAIAPVVADIYEDAGFRFKTKKLANDVVRAIRKLDEHIMNTAELDATEEQIKAQIAFRQWLKTEL